MRLYLIVLLQKLTAENEAIISMLIDVEKKFNLAQTTLRGMLLAAACHESGFNPKAAGDHKFSKEKKSQWQLDFFKCGLGGKSHYKIDRTNPEQSATAYMSHMLNQNLIKLKGNVAYKELDRLWVSCMGNCY